MQITTPVVCNAYNSIYKKSTTLCVCEHAFLPTEFLGWLAYASFCGSGGIMSTARPELPCPLFPRPSHEKTSRGGGGGGGGGGGE